jgi:hypothetical protein
LTHSRTRRYSRPVHIPARLSDHGARSSSFGSLPRCEERRTRPVRASPCAAGRRGLAVEMMVRDKLRVACRTCRSPSGLTRPRHSCLIDRPNRSACGVAFEALSGVRATRMPASPDRCRTTRTRFRSRSQIAFSCQPRLDDEFETDTPRQRSPCAPRRWRQGHGLAPHVFSHSAWHCARAF